jgi:hypothetical protein
MSDLKLKLRASFLPPLVKNDTIEQNGIQSISLRNGGTSVVTINNAWNLAAGETLHISAVSNVDEIEFNNILITFAAGGTNLLQIMILKAADC